MEKSVFMATGRNVFGGSTFPSKKECTTLIEHVENLLNDNVNECVQHSLNIIQRSDALRIFHDDLKPLTRQFLTPAKSREFAEILDVASHELTITRLNNYSSDLSPIGRNSLTIAEIHPYVDTNIIDTLEESYIVSPVRNYGNSLTGVGINIITINPALPHGDPNILSAIEETLTFSTQT